MGFLKFSTFWSCPREVRHDVSIDLTMKYPRRTRPTLPSIPRPVARLPMEIILNILEDVYYNDVLEPDVDLLRNCSLVCKDWTAPAQKLLFRQVSLRSCQGYMSFRNAVRRSTERGRALGDAVVRLRVTLDYNQPRGLSQHSIARAILLCPNLFELDMSLYGSVACGREITDGPEGTRMYRTVPPFSNATLSLLRSGPRLKALRFSNWSENVDVTCQLLDVWPELDSVALRGRPPKVPSGSLDGTGATGVHDAYRGKLREVRLNFQSGPSPEFAVWLLGNSSQTLRVLELEREPSSELLEQLIDAHGATLESLSIPASGSHDHALAVQKCVQLREFKVENAWTSPSVLRKLPPTLQHLAFGLDRDTPLHVIVDTIKTRGDIRAVTVHLWNGEEAHGALLSLRNLCDAKGIEFSTTTHIQRFRAVVRADPLPCSSYPRIKSISGLRTMLSVSRGTDLVQAPRSMPLEQFDCLLTPPMVSECNTPGSGSPSEAQEPHAKSEHTQEVRHAENS